MDEAAALAYLAVVWQEQWPEEHPYKECIVPRLLTWWSGLRDAHTRLKVLQQGQRGEVSVHAWPDSIHSRPRRVLGDGSEVVERLRTGRPTKSEVGKDIYALYVTAAQAAEPRVRRSVQVRYLSADHVTRLTYNLALSRLA